MSTAARREINIHVHQKTHQRMFLAALYVIFPNWALLKCSSTVGRINTWRYNHAMGCTATGMNRPKPHETTRLILTDKTLMWEARCERLPAPVSFI